MFVHVVLFWLKDDAPADARTRLLSDCREILGQVPTLRHLSAGHPAMTPREVVDNSYDVGLCTVFDDRAGHDIYQTHAHHLEFIARNKPHWARVQIYDFE
jgi:hypothetical protein